MTNTTNPNETNLNPIPCSAFTWTTDTRTLSIEASDRGRGNPFSRLYNDACDIGLAIESGRTGRVARFVVWETHTDGEGDITHWTLRPTPETTHRCPETSGLRVIVWND